MEQLHKKKIIVCGVRFGQFYLEAVSKSEDYELAGILSTGSQRSMECANLYGVKQYSSVNQLPNDIDIACVVVRTGTLGGNGIELVEQLMKRKIHVLLEQPVHVEELKMCYRTAIQCGVAFSVGNLYAQLPAVQKFLSMAEKMIRRQKPLYVNVDMATQVAFPLAYILSCLFPRCKKIRTIEKAITEDPFDMVGFKLGDVPLSVRAQNQMERGAGDNYTHLFFQISIGFPAGTLSLTDIHGAVVWRLRMTIPEQMWVPRELKEKAPTSMREESIRTFYSCAGMSYEEILSELWPNAILADIHYLAELIEGKKIKENNYKNVLILQASEMWRMFTSAFGYPKECPNALNEYLDIEEIIAEEFSALTMKERYERVSKEETEKCLRLLNLGSILAILQAFQNREIFAEQGISFTIEEIYIRLKCQPEFHFIVDRWLNILSAYELISRDQNGYCLNQSIQAGLQVNGLWERAVRLWTNRLGTAQVGDYFYKNAVNLNQMLEGEVSARYLLFPDGKEYIANDLYRNTMIAWYMNDVIAEMVSNYLSEHESVSILEVGAGTGATTDVVIERIHQEQKQSKLERYYFSDLSKYFLNTAEEKYGKYHYFSTGILNLDEQEDFERITNKADIIIAAGVLNNVNHIDSCLTKLKEKLSDRGIILISEAITDSLQMQISQIFMMRPVKDEREKTMRTFMSEEQWHTSFRTAGLTLKWSKPSDDHKLIGLGQKVFCLEKADNA